MNATKMTFPNRPCPKCGNPIHIKTKKHEECGWGIEATAETTSPTVKKVGKVGKAIPRANNFHASVSLEDIQAVKDVVGRLGAATVKQLAEVLEKSKG